MTAPIEHVHSLPGKTVPDHQRRKIMFIPIARLPEGDGPPQKVNRND